MARRTFQDRARTARLAPTPPMQSPICGFCRHEGTDVNLQVFRQRQMPLMRCVDAFACVERFRALQRLGAV